MTTQSRKDALNEFPQFLSLASILNAEEKLWAGEITSHGQNRNRPVDSEGDVSYVAAMTTGEVRRPKKGEWYKSANQGAFRAHSDFDFEHEICHLVIIKKTVTITREVTKEYTP